MSGKIIGVYPSKEHICKLPIKLFKRTSSVFLCDCNKFYILEWQRIARESDRVWRNISYEELRKIRGY
jgi:hypothetical protein